MGDFPSVPPRASPEPTISDVRAFFRGIIIDKSVKADGKKVCRKILFIFNTKTAPYFQTLFFFHFFLYGN